MTQTFTSSLPYSQPEISKKGPAIKDAKQALNLLMAYHSFIMHRLGSRPLLTIPLSLLTLAGSLCLVKAVRDFLRKRKHEDKWVRHEDLDQIQICLLSAEHLSELGRIEKRTLMVRSLREFFGQNDYVVDKVLDAAHMAAAGAEPIVSTYLSQEDKWHVLNTCTNHISSLFAPYHVFFNEARRCQSYYRSAWYAFTITCSRSTGEGRFFITPGSPVPSRDDVGALRIRIIMINEQEMRDILSGGIEPPRWGFFNDRHRNRWDIMKRFSQLFERQLAAVAAVHEGNASLDLPPLPNFNPNDRPTHLKDWGPNLCGRLGAAAKSRNLYQSVGPVVTGQSAGGSKLASPPQFNPNAQYQEATQIGKTRVYSPEDNCFLRIHIPFPSARAFVGDGCFAPSEKKVTSKHEILDAYGASVKTMDVVLFE